MLHLNLFFVLFCVSPCVTGDGGQIGVFGSAPDPPGPKKGDGIFDERSFGAPSQWCHAFAEMFHAALICNAINWWQDPMFASIYEYFFIKSLISTAFGSGPLRAERRRREARREILTTPGLVTAWPSILGPLAVAKGRPPAGRRPGPSYKKCSFSWYLSPAKSLFLTVSLSLFHKKVNVAFDTCHERNQGSICCTGWFFSLVPPNFSTKKKAANQPIRAAVPVNPELWLAAC